MEKEVESAGDPERHGGRRCDLGAISGRTATTDAGDARLGSSWGPFRLLQLLHRGRLACSYLAERGDGGQVSLKILQPFADVREQRFRLVREAELQARCAHPGIVRVLEAGELAGFGAFIAREYVEGCTLAERVREGLDPRLRDRVARVLLEVLGHVHDQRDAEGRRVGLLHRDVTPANVLLGRDGSVKLTDFGLSHAPAWHGPLADDELAQGTRRYLPPEVLRGEPPDERSDLFQLALCLAEAGDPACVGPLSAAVTGGVAEVLDRALDPSPQRRYASAQEMAVAWRRAADGTGR